MNRMFVASAFAALSLSVAAPAFAWDEIASRQVADRVDVDNIPITGDHAVSRIKVCVYDNPVHFYDVDIFFKNGGHQDVAVRARVNAGECTRNINLKGGNRNIDRIRFKYEETSWFVGRALVRVFAE